MTQRAHKIYRTNNPLPPCIHILRNRDEYETKADTLQLLKTYYKSTHFKCWEALYIQLFHQHKLLIIEQEFNVTNPLYKLANITHVLPLYP